jgi:glycosyltransferase involved in cell wall biosynthesis
MTVTTRALRDTLERSIKLPFPEGEALVIPNGVDLAEYSNLPTAREARRNLSLEERFTVGFTGHIYPGRGAELLFELARRFPETMFLWVGGNPETIETWRDKAATAKLRNVILTGFVEHSRVPLYQAAAEVLLMPYGHSVSASSGQEIAGVINPMKMFEYMAAGRAILSADLPSIREILSEESAVFCEPDDLESWTNALTLLLKDERRRLALGAHAHQEAEKYSWKSRAEKILEGWV